jgi:serine/threonine protein kinase
MGWGPVLLPDFSARETLAQFLGHHRNIVRVLGTTEDQLTIVMERAVTDLHRVVKHTCGPLPFAYARQWARDILSALQHIHAMRVIHQVRTPAPL